MTTSQSQVVAVLKAARERLERGYVPHMPHGEHEDCAGTAVLAALESFDSDWTDDDVYFDYIKRATGCDAIVQWSDAGPKSKVVEGFDAAISLALAEQERAE